MSNNSNHYTLAGWLAIVLAVMLIPQIGLSILDELVSKKLNIFMIPVHVINALIGLFLLITFRKLLNNEFNFFKVNSLITIQIIISIAIGVIGIIGATGELLGMGKGFEVMIAMITLAFFVPYNIVMIIFGVQIQKMEDDMFGLLKPFAYATIGSGICGATVLLIPIGLLFAMTALVIEGMIFLRANREAEIL
jgi:hypothetical protein